MRCAHSGYERWGPVHQLCCPSPRLYLQQGIKVTFQLTRKSELFESYRVLTGDPARVPGTGVFAPLIDGVARTLGFMPRNASHFSLDPSPTQVNMMCVFEREESERARDRQTHRHTDTQTHRHTDTQTERQRDRARQSKREREREMTSTVPQVELPLRLSQSLFFLDSDRRRCAMSLASTTQWSSSEA